jgi:hypothetical protein
LKKQMSEIYVNLRKYSVYYSFWLVGGCLIRPKATEGLGKQDFGCLCHWSDETAQDQRQLWTPVRRIWVASAFCAM